jgi:hypothetical protein
VPLVSGGGGCGVIGLDGEATVLATDVVALVRLLTFPLVFNASFGVESVHCEGVVAGGDAEGGLGVVARGGKEWRDG